MTVTQLEAFGLTLAIEGAVAAALAVQFKLRPLAAVAAAIVGSTVTHPLLWYVHPRMVDILGDLTTPVLEGAVIALETLPYRALATRRWDEAALLSLLANAASWWIGEIIYAL